MKNVTYINAGAGSGKTYTLTSKLAEKLSDRSAGVTPSQVILTTFTELAAAEFREKARQQICSVRFVQRTEFRLGQEGSRVYSRKEPILLHNRLGPG